MPIDQRLKNDVRRHLNRNATVRAMIQASEDEQPAVSAIGREATRTIRC